MCPSPLRALHTPLRLAVALLVLFGTLAVSPPARAADPPAAPTRISCQGSAATKVLVYWQDNASDETNYIVERQVGAGGWSVLATLGANIGAYEDGSADTSNQNSFYRVKAYRSGDSSSSAYSATCNNRRIATTDHFRLFYGLKGTNDACPTIDGWDVCLTNTTAGGNNVFIARQQEALEGTLGALDRVGFAPGSAGTPPSGLDRIPINVVWCDGGGCAGGGGLGLSPYLLEQPFDLAARTGDPIAWLVALHEVFHFQQYQYPGLADPADGWAYEGQARSIQDKLCIGADRATCKSFDDIATGYAGYVPEVMGYLSDPSRSINRTDYQAALFWTYLTEKYGTSAPGDSVEGGMNLMVKFWEAARDNPGSDGITTLNTALASLGHTARFRDIWKDFAVANYAKGLTGTVPAKYTYADMAQPGGNYGPVALALSTALTNGAQFVRSGEFAAAWGARYYELRPAADVPVIDIKITQDSTAPVYYTILGIKGQNIVYEFNQEARNLNRTLINNAYDKVVVVVAALDQLANYRYSFNGTRPALRVVVPTTANPARVGNPAAPDKFRVAVEVTAADGTPLTGVDLANFSFRVGAVEVPGSGVLTSAHVQNQQWFVVRAPGQSASGSYDLLVRYGSVLSGTVPLGVSYIPRNDADSIVTVDRSGSMLANSKLVSAKLAARLYVDSYRTGDRIGIISFNENVATDLALTPWTDSPSGGSRLAALTAINAFTAGGNTALGDALRASWNSLKTAGDPAHDWAIVFLSDGLQTAGTEQFGSVITALYDDPNKKPVVHAIALGPDADQALMQWAANSTGGTYQYVSVPADGEVNVAAATPSALKLDLDLRYRAVATEVAGQQQVFSLNGPLADGDPNVDRVRIPVENGAAELVLSLSVDGRMVSTSLSSPDGTFIDPFKEDSRHIVYRVPSPQGGNWSLLIGNPPPIIKGAGDEVTPQQSGEMLPPYLIHAALRSDTTMDVALPTPLDERRPGAPMVIVASLTDTAPISGATVRARVTAPDGGVRTLSLYDDGLHGDGAAGDGVYGGTYWHTAFAGSYTVLVTATGSGSLSGPFTREKVLGFFLQGAGDPDGDGLDSSWETTYGTDPNVADATADPDHDGLPNSGEAEHGTDPRDPDSDDGGQQDGGDPDPRDPADDGIAPTWAVADAGVSKVLVHYTLRPSYTRVEIWRSVGREGPYALQLSATPGDGLLIDTAVANGTEYCYVAVAADVTGRRSAPLDPSCATPQADPHAPTGSVLINGGARETTSRRVTLTLWATDAIDPESVVPGSEDELPPAASATRVVEMLISNRPDQRDASWEPYQRTKVWQLSQTSGLGVVYARFRDTTGLVSSLATATIKLNIGERICTPNPEADLSGWRVADGTGAIKNRSRACAYDVGIAVYRRFEAAIDSQRLYDWALATIEPGETIRLDARLPACSAQVDLFYGTLLNLLNGQRYGERRLGDWNTAGPFCAADVPPVAPPGGPGGGIVPRLAPQAPLNVARVGSTDGGITLRWRSAGGADIVGYQILRGAQSGGPYIQVGATSATSYVDRGAPGGVGLYYIVRAYNERGELSAPSAELAVSSEAVVYLPLIARQ